MVEVGVVVVESINELMQTILQTISYNSHVAGVALQCRCQIKSPIDQISKSVSHFEKAGVQLLVLASLCPSGSRLA